jgi:ethanolamine transporter
MLGLLIGFFLEFVLPAGIEVSFFPQSFESFSTYFNSIYDGLAIAGVIALVLSGSLPFIHFISVKIQSFSKKYNNFFFDSNNGLIGMFATLTNNIAMFHMMGKMSERDRVINVAFSVGAAFLVGDHLAFTAAVRPDLIYAVLIPKFVVGLLAVVFAIFYWKFVSEKNVTI